MLNIDEWKELPDEKIEEILVCVAGEIKECPECGELTAFVGSTGWNSVSECHHCGHEENVIG